MMSNPEHLLASLRDVAGVEGSWLLGTDGQIHARDLSALYSDAILAALKPRFLQMTDVIADHLPGCGEDLSLRFQSRTLHLRRAGSLILVVLALPTTNIPSLRIGLHLVFRQLTAPPVIAPPPASFPAPAPRAVGVPPRPPAVAPRPGAPARPAPPAAKPQSNSIWGS